MRFVMAVLLLSVLASTQTIKQTPLESCIAERDYLLHKSFSAPIEQPDYEALRLEYNALVSKHNQLVDSYNDLASNNRKLLLYVAMQPAQPSLPAPIYSYPQRVKPVVTYCDGYSSPDLGLGSYSSVDCVSK